MNIAPPNRVALNAPAGSGAKTVNFGVGATWVVVQSKAFSVGAIWQKNQSVTFGLGALWQGGSTKFFGIGAYWATPYHDNAPYGQMIGNNLVKPIDPNRLSTWSTYTRPASPIDGMTGRNVQTGKLETWDEKNNVWKDAAGNSL